MNNSAGVAPIKAARTTNARRLQPVTHLVSVCYPLCLTVTKYISSKELRQALCYSMCLFVTPCYSIFLNIAVISAVNFYISHNT